MNDDAQGCLAVFAFLIMFGIGATLANHFWERWRCGARAEMAGVASKYTVLDGCFFQIGGKYIQEERYRVVDEVRK